MSETEISLVDIWGTIKKNFTLFIIIPLIAVLCALFVTNVFIHKTYSASVKLYVDTEIASSSNYENILSHNYAETMVDTYIQMLDTNNFYSELSEALRNAYTPAQLKSMVTFTRIEETEVFCADVTAATPAEAKMIADAVSQTAPKMIEKLNARAQLKIVDDAVLPQKPTSPNVMKNTLLAFLAGIVIAFIIAFIRDYFDVKIKYNDSMTMLCDYPILAVIPDFECFSEIDKKIKKPGHKAGKN